MDSNYAADQSPRPDLPLDLIIKIASFLDTRIDHLRFRSVCKSWRSSIPKPLSPNPRLATLPFSGPDFNYGRRVRTSTITLSQTEIYHLSDPSGRAFVSSFVGVEEVEDGKMKARHPMSGKNLGQCRKVLDLSNLRVIQVGKLFYMKCEHSGRREYACYVRVVASLNEDGKSSGLASFNDVCVVGIFGEKLMHFVFKDAEWVAVHHGWPTFPYVDVIYRKGKFYAVDEARRLVIVDSLMNVEVVNSPDVLSAGLMSNSNTSYLVNCGGELHLLVLYYGEEDDIRDPFNTKFLMYRFEEERRDWVRLLSLGDWAIFVSRFGSFGVYVPEVCSCRKNCIYFKMDIQAECSNFGDHSVCFTAVFDVAKGSCDDFTSDFKSPGSIAWNLEDANFSFPDSREC